MKLSGSLKVSGFPLSFAMDISSSDLKSGLMEMISMEHDIGTKSRMEYVNNSRFDQISAYFIF